MSDESTGSEIAVVGRAGRFPGASDLEAFWRNLAAGVESITFFTPEELRAAGVPEEILRDPVYVPARGVVAGADGFDAPLFAMSPREARITDPQHRLFLECAWEALEDAGCDPARFPGLIGVFAGASFSRYMLAVHADPELGGTVDPFQLTVANDKDFLATRVSYKLGLEGPAFTVQTACSTSLVAVHLACQALLNGECDLALAGGVSVPWPQENGYLWTEGMVLSPDGHCRAFDESGQGTVAGNGAGIVVLRRLEDALEAGDAIRAVIRGSAINNDGSRKVGYTAPRVEGQAKAIRSAQIVAEVDARDISYVEAHGTGTPLGDPIEVAALTRAFRVTTQDTGFCALGSVKTNIGHLDAAAGVAGLIKTVLALEHRQIPPSLHCETPSPRIDFAGSPFFVNRELRDWETEDGAPRLAGVSSFGIGGTNAHVLLEEAPEPAPSGPAREHQLLILTARSETALEVTAERLAAYLEQRPDLSASDLADAAFTLRRGRRELEHRRAVVARDAAGAVAALRGQAAGRSAAGRAGEGRAAAFLFPGLGGQHAGLGRGLLEAEPLFRREIEACAETLRPLLGLDPMRLFAPPAGTDAEAEELLESIAISMPVLFALEQSLGRLWMSWGVKPKALLGHSLGEYAAACLAGVFSREDGLRIMAARGALLAQLPPGAMLSVPLTEEETAPLLSIEGLWLATINGPRTAVLSGAPEAIEEAERRLAAEGRPGRRVRARGAYHSGMIAPLQEAFRAEVAKVRLAAPALPFLSNVTGTWIRVDQATDPGYWAEHLRRPVRFADGLTELLRDSGIVPVELGPGRTLATLAAERLGGSRPALTSLRHPREEAADAEVLYASLGRLWVEGVPVDWASFAADEERRKVPLPTYPFERERYTVASLSRVARESTERIHLEAPAEVASDVGDWFHVSVWRQTPPPAEADKNRLRGPWLVLTTGEGVGERIARRLEELGETVTRAVPGEALDPGRPETFDALLAALAEEDLSPAHVLHAWCLGSLQVSDLGSRLARTETLTDLGFRSLLALAQAMGRRPGAGPLRLTVLSDRLHRIAGESGDGTPEAATLLGPVLVIPREFPGAVCRNIDIALPSSGSEEEADLVEDLLAELVAAAPPVVAWRGGTRWEPGIEPFRLDKPARPLEMLAEGGTYLITGGLGAMGLAFAERFARRVRVKIALLSRHGLPKVEGEAPDASDTSRDRLRRVRAIEALGSEVLVVKADAADPEAMAAAVATVRERLGPIRGAVHAAGVLGAGLLQRKTRQSADAVLGPKVQGTLILDALLRGEPLDFFVLCSSLSGLSGALGQIDYCAANAFLDAFAGWRGRPAVAIDWGRWIGEGMAEAARGARDRRAATEVHPLLGARHSQGPTRTVYSARLSASSSWVLDEHRLLERPLLPGTAYLEMARAAFEDLAGAGPVELSGVLFWTPLIVPAGGTVEVYTVLDRREDGEFAFQILSAEEGSEGRRLRRHASGSVRPLTPTGEAAARERAGRALEQLPQLAAAPEVETEPGAAAFGPRWRCLRACRMLGDEGLADLGLEPAHSADVQVYHLHPALLDAATGFASAGRVEGFHLPLSYGAVRVLAPLTPEVRSWARRRDAGAGVFTSDIVIATPAGEPLVEIEAFTKRWIDPEQGAADLNAAAAGQSGGAARDRSLIDPAEIPEIDAPASGWAAAGSEPGMLPAQGVEALERILGSRRRLSQVAVSVQPLTLRPGRVALVPTASTVPAAASSAKESRRVDPGDLEGTLRRLWAAALGMPDVGVDDNFFALGGDSIIGLQVVSKARELGLELAPGQIFEHQTIAGLAAALRGAAPVPIAAATPEPVAALPAFQPDDFPLTDLDEAGLGRLFEQIAALDEEEA
jgi:acyl transferase domain-containing protein